MRTIYLTGSTGFVGTAFSEYFSRDRIVCHPKTSTVNIGNASIVVNLAGKAKDTGGTRNSEEYFHVNYEFAKSVFDAFLESKAEVFITMSSVKAVADSFDGLLSEDTPPRPISTYGKSKLLGEQYILSKQLPEGKLVYILRPCIIHGPGNKGNLSLLYKTVSIGIPWFLGSYNNKRSYCSIENLLFVLNELIERKDIPSGIYHVADDLPLSTNEVISIIAETRDKKPFIWKVPKGIILFCAKLGNVLKFPLNEERLMKLTDSYVVSSEKLIDAIGKPLPVSCRDGLLKTFQSFK